MFSVYFVHYFSSSRVDDGGVARVVGLENEDLVLGAWAAHIHVGTGSGSDCRDAFKANASVLEYSTGGGLYAIFRSSTYSIRCTCFPLQPQYYVSPTFP